MDLHFLRLYLTEAKKPTRRSKWRQNLRTQTGQETRASFSPLSQRVRTFIRKNNIPYRHRSFVAKLYYTCEKIIDQKYGTAAINLKQGVLEDYVLKVYQNHKKELDKNYSPSGGPAPVRISGIYSSPGKVNMLSIRDLAADFRMMLQNTATPVVKRYAEINKEKGKGTGDPQREKAQKWAQGLVHQAVTSPHDPSLKGTTKTGEEYYYVLTRLKPQKDEVSTEEYEITIPSSFDFRKGGKAYEIILDLTKDPSQNVMKYWTTSNLNVLKSEKNRDLKFEDMVQKWQNLAWNQLGAKQIYVLVTSLSSKGLTEAEKLKKLLNNLRSHPEIAEAVTWYLWLINAENFYGIYVPERKSLRKFMRSYNDEPEGKFAQITRIGATPIRHKRIAHSNRVDPAVANALGLSSHNVEQFVKRISKPGQPTAKFTTTWFPIRGDLRQFGIDPILDAYDARTLIQRSISQKRVQNRIHSLGGFLGNTLEVKRNVPIKIWAFKLGGQKSVEFALVKASDYLSYFDQPTIGKKPGLVHYGGEHRTRGTSFDE